MKSYLAAFLLLLGSTLAQAAPVPAPPAIAAKGFLLMDMNSGRILAEKNSRERMEPASLTKIMTAHVVFSEIRTIKDQRRTKHEKKEPIKGN